MQASLYKIILCDFINPLTDRKASLFRNAAVVLKRVSSKGDNSANYKFLEKGKCNTILKKYSNKRSITIIDKSNMLMLPTFFDMHFHWVQDDVRLMPKANLLTWLSKYTWPYEEKFKSKNYAKKRAKEFKNRLLSVGTLGGACYSSIHGHTVDYAIDYFVGDFTVGNVLMTMNSPDYLCQTKDNALKIVKEKSAKYKKRYAVTPRFAPTTDPDVMLKSSKIAKRNNSFIQTHLSETTNEIDYVLSIYKKFKKFENIKTYTDIYNQCGVLGDKTIMGHGIHLSKSELKLLAMTKTSIAHCPTSNAPVKESGLGSGLFDFKKIEKAKIRWALASDIGGGPFLSMFDVMRSFVVQNQKKKIKDATFVKALFRSTIAGANILGIDKSHGNLDDNKLANFILIKSPTASVGESVEDVLRKVVMSKEKQRHNYSDLVISTYYKGNETYNVEY